MITGHTMEMNMATAMFMKMTAMNNPPTKLGHNGVKPTQIFRVS